MQNLWDPSFFRTITTGLDQGLVDGSITPAACILSSYLTTSSLTANGIHRGGHCRGSASPVSMCISTRSVSPHLPSSSAKVWWCSLRKSRSFCCCAGLRFSKVPRLSNSCCCLQAVGLVWIHHRSVVSSLCSAVELASPEVESITVTGVASPRRLKGHIAPSRVPDDGQNSILG